MFLILKELEILESALTKLRQTGATLHLFHPTNYFLEFHEQLALRDFRFSKRYCEFKMTNLNGKLEHYFQHSLLSIFTHAIKRH